VFNNLSNSAKPPNLPSPLQGNSIRCWRNPFPRVAAALLLTLGHTIYCSCAVLKSGKSGDLTSPYAHHYPPLRLSALPIFRSL